MLTPRDRGSVLLLFPTAVVVMMVMAAVVIDVAHVQMEARRLHDVAGSAANDALAALDVTALRRGEGIVIPPPEARRVVVAAVGAGPVPDARVEAVEVGADPLGRPVIAVTLAVDVDLLMAPAVGDLRSVTVRRRAEATIVRSR